MHELCPTLVLPPAPTLAGTGSHHQRGLSLYYVGQYEEGARQFRDDVAVNPSDTEESIWCVKCGCKDTGKCCLSCLVCGP